MGRKALKVDEASLACARMFSEIRNRRGISMYRIKQDFHISHGRIDRLFKGQAPWMLDDFTMFCNYFAVSASESIKEIERLSSKESIHS